MYTYMYTTLSFILHGEIVCCRLFVAREKAYTIGRMAILEFRRCVWGRITLRKETPPPFTSCLIYNKLSGAAAASRLATPDYRLRTSLTAAESEESNPL